MALAPAINAWWARAGYLWRSKPAGGCLQAGRIPMPIVSTAAAAAPNRRNCRSPNFAERGLQDDVRQSRARLPADAARATRPRAGARARPQRALWRAAGRDRPDHGQLPESRLRPADVRSGAAAALAGRPGSRRRGAGPLSLRRAPAARV